MFANQISGLQGAVSGISGVVNTLEKLRKLDPELLEKYSKVYFLSENYIPAQLSIIDTQYLYNQAKPEQFYSQALPFLQRMLEAAKGENITLKIVSAYRSFEQQAAVKSGYKITYGSGANKFSADQGYSEHQLGTTCDFTTPETKAVFSKFEGTPAYKWLQENAYKFGFELSYPKNNSFYQFEPWHWRFVGVALATKLHDENKYFYELTQREIDPYLISIFD
jgi:D-alanyl-D-alanine carboxypeptidase